MGLATGARLGPYDIVAPLGAGGMGGVYKAKDTRLDRTVAHKILRAPLAGDPHFRERFDREAHTISQLSGSRLLRCEPRIHKVLVKVGIFSRNP
jgi:serine/threonine protein kinase